MAEEGDGMHHERRVWLNREIVQSLGESQALK